MPIGFHLDDIEESYFKNHDIKTNRKTTDHQFPDEEDAILLLKWSVDIHSNLFLTPETVKTLLDLINRQKAESEKLKADTAKVIFEEIEKIIDEMYNRFIFKKQPYDSDEEIEAIINYSDSVSDAIAALKMKYSEASK